MTQKQIAIIGGGIVGILTALDLQKRNCQVTLLDPKEPGSETSYGNSGVLSEASVVISNNPNLKKRLPQLIKGKSNALTVRFGFVIKNLPWIIQFLSHCTDQHLELSSQALRNLQKTSLKIHKELIKEAGANNLLRETGWLKIFRSEKSFAAYNMELNVLKRRGVNYIVFNSEELRQIEPSLKPIFYKGVLLQDTCSVSSPFELCKNYVRLFKIAGGKVVQNAVTKIKRPNQWNITLKNNKNLEADEVVIAAGPWSAEIAGSLGYRIPMAWERGYHLHLEPGPGINRPIHDVDAGYVMSPQLQGVRITSGVELADREAPKSFLQIFRAVASAKEAVKLGKTIEDTPWMGRRPTLIDSLPMIGKAPKHNNLWFNFGHQHNGLSTSAGSAKILTALLHHETPPIDPNPFRPTRFRL